MFMYISNVFICIYGLVSCAKLFKITADYLNIKVVTYDWVILGNIFILPGKYYIPKEIDLFH